MSYLTQQSQEITSQSQVLDDNLFGPDRSANPIADVYWLLGTVLLLSFLVLLGLILLSRLGRKPE